MEEVQSSCKEQDEQAGENSPEESGSVSLSNRSRPKEVGFG